MEINKIYNEDCLATMSKMPDDFVDLVVTSPPYDNLRTYKEYSFDFENIARELYRIIKTEGVVVWIVNDATINGSETGTSFRQALFFKEIGFSLFDTMIWRKVNPTPTDPRIGRYTSSFEYMFILSKTQPKTRNLIRQSCKNAGKVRGSCGNPSQLEPDGTVRMDRISKRSGQAVKDTKPLSNVWELPISAGYKGHPATFPEKLANDHMVSWSNPGDLVYDPFLGSGTTAKVAILSGRNYIGSEISKEYCELAEKRIEECQQRNT